MDQYKIDRVKARLQLMRYLMSLADERGYTHGEKHHFIQVCLSELLKALHEMGDDNNPMQNSDTDPKSVTISDIPF